MTKPHHVVSQPPEPTWTPERIERLKTLWVAEPQISAGAIGKLLGLSKNSVVAKAHRLGLPSRPSPIKPARLKPLQRRIQAVELPVPHAEPPERPISPLPVANVGRAPAPTRRRLASLPQRLGPSPFRTCQWIAKEDGPFTDADKCGAGTVPGSSYCPEHRARSVTGVLAKERAA